jgi:hypothetical protein
MEETFGERSAINKRAFRKGEDAAFLGSMGNIRFKGETLEQARWQLIRGSSRTS